MATVYDGIAELVALIDSSWIDANTSNKKPNIGKILDYPFDLQFADKKGFVLLYSLNESEEMPGMGKTESADVNETVKIDIRIFDDEPYFNQVKTELKRILYLNRASGTTTYCNFDLDNKNVQNLSNRMKRVFREVREVTITALNRNMTT